MRREIGGVFLRENGRIVVVLFDHAAVDGLQQQAHSDLVVFDVLFDVLNGRIDGRFVHFVGRDAVVESEACLGGDLGHHRDRIGEPCGRALNRAVDLVRIELLFLPVVLCDRECHINVCMCAAAPNKNVIINGKKYVSRMNYPRAEKAPKLFTSGSAHTEMSIAVLIMPPAPDKSMKKKVWIVHRDTKHGCVQGCSRVRAM